MIAVFRPSCAARMAATYPPGPAPIIATSKGVCSFKMVSRAVSDRPAGLENVEMLLVQEWIGLDDDVLFCPFLEVVDGNEFSALKNLRYFRIHAHRDFLALDKMRHLLDFLLNVV